jgi:DNA invertase Pin-like site-specific DNA recombinase
MSKRVAIYTRVATYATEGRLLQRLEACREFAQKRAWRVVAEVADRGVSGVTRDRAGLDRIRDIAQVGQIDAVIVCSPDRLARDVNLLRLLEEELQKRGIEIHCTSSCPMTIPFEATL